jgi:hypothetical protein
VCVQGPHNPVTCTSSPWPQHLPSLGAFAPDLECSYPQLIASLILWQDTAIPPSGFLVYVRSGWVWVWGAFLFVVHVLQYQAEGWDSFQLVSADPSQGPPGDQLTTQRFAWPFVHLDCESSPSCEPTAWLTWREHLTSHLGLMPGCLRNTAGDAWGL